MSNPRNATALMLLCLVAGCAGHAPSGPPAVADQAGVVTVTMSDFAYRPEVLALRVGQPVRLHLVNASGGGHNFQAPAFFAASRVEGPPPKDGSIEVAGHGTADLVLTPLSAGRYEVVCTHPLHELFGMVGGIEVSPAS